LKVSDADSFDVTYQYLRRILEIYSTTLMMRQDMDLAASGKEIVYIFDADIIGFFLQPERDRNYARIPGVHLSDRQRTALAIQTAEVLFSGRLPGQKAGIYLSAYHLRDLDSQISSLERKAQQGFTGADTEDQATLSEHMEIRLAKLSQATSGQMALLKDLFASNLIRPFETARGFVAPTPAELSVSASRWYRSITAAQRANEGRSLSTIKINRDARTCALIETWARRLEAEGTKKVPRLVTGDHSIWQAYVSDLLDSKTTTNLELLVRRPFQYAPFFLQSDPDDRLTEQPIARVIEEAAEQILPYFNVPTGDPVRAVQFWGALKPSYDAETFLGSWVAAAFKQGAGEIIQSRFRDIAQNWRKAADSALYLSQRWIRRRAKRLESEWPLRDLHARNLRYDAASSKKSAMRLIRELYFRHIPFNAFSTISVLGHRDPTQVLPLTNRTPLIWTFASPEFIDEETLDFRQIIDRVLQPLSENENRQLYEYLEEDSVRALAFGAMCALGAGHWQTAATMAKRADLMFDPTGQEQKDVPESIRHGRYHGSLRPVDLAIIRSVCARYDSFGVISYSEARRGLQQELARKQRNAFTSAQLQVELGALNLFALQLSLTGSVGTKALLKRDDATPETILAGTQDILYEGFASAQSLEPPETGPSALRNKRNTQRLRYQAASNVVSLEAAKYVVPGSQALAQHARPSSDLLAQAFDMLRSYLATNLDGVPAVVELTFWYVHLRRLDMNKEAERLDALRHVRSSLGEILQSEQHVPEVDRAIARSIELTLAGQP
jgi:hypothetical protein